MFPCPWSTALSLDAGINHGRVKQRDLSLLQVQMSVQTQMWSCYRLFHYSYIGCLALRMNLVPPKLGLSSIHVLNQKMFSDPQDERQKQRRERESSVPGFWILPSISLPSQLYCAALQASSLPEKQAHFLQPRIQPAPHEIIITAFRK